MRSIGELARDSGLTVSALRFYDGADVFGPAWVDPQTGYRWYGEKQVADARLLARLRRVGLPLAEIRLVLEAEPGSGVAHRIVDAHLLRLRNGLADARRELSFVRALIDQREHPVSQTRTATRITVGAAELAAALDAVRFAVGGNPETPFLSGVLFDIEGELLRLVATDRYRMALSEVPLAAPDGVATAVIVPATLADGIRALLAGGGQAELTVDAGRIVLEAAGHRIEGAGLDHDYPDYRRLVRLEPTRRTELPAAVLAGAVEAAATRWLPREVDGVDCEVLVLSISSNGELSTEGGPFPEDQGDALRVAVNREFLLDAIRAGGSDQLVLEFGGPIAPLAIRTPGNEGTFSVLMPVRLP